MRNTKKAVGKKPSTNKIIDHPIEERFRAIAQVHGTDDPELIKQKIMWSYIHLLVKANVTPGMRPHIDNHADQFEACNRYIEHQCVKLEQHKA